MSEEKNPMEEQENQREEEVPVAEAESADEPTAIPEYRIDPMATEGALFREDAERSPKARKPIRISLSTFLISAVALILAAVMVTYTVCSGVYKQQLADARLETNQTAGYTPFELFYSILEEQSFEELDEDEMMAAALKAYVAASGDRYAEYYTPEEYEALTASTAGNSEGIGINIINTTAQVSGYEYKVIRVINVMDGSPAEEAGMQVGDLIWAAGIGEDAETVHELGYDMALTKLKGAAGTVAEFTALRPDGDGYTPMEFKITRGAVTTSSVYYHKLESDPTVGVIKLLQFDLTLPKQFSAAIDELTAEGCTKFVFDVRYNPGGDLRSIQAVLSYFLEEGDILIRTKDNSGEEEISTVAPVAYSGDYEGCSVSREDIGKYADLSAVILCNGSTASAAELFVATFRDYDKLDVTIVGTTTFGKGSMQSIMPLYYYGFDGALKLTTAMYYPASGNGYEGEGITPDVTVELNEDAANKNIYELSDAEDNQLQAALEYLN